MIPGLKTYQWRARRLPCDAFDPRVKRSVYELTVVNERDHFADTTPQSGGDMWARLIRFQILAKRAMGL